MSARKAASSRATSSQASGPMTVSQESSGTKVARPWTRPISAPRPADWPRQSSTSRAMPTGASGHQSYGGNASATRAPLTAAPASRGPSPRGRQRDGAVPPCSAAGASRPGAVLVTVLRILPGRRRGPAHRRGPTRRSAATTAKAGLRRYNARRGRAVPTARRRGVRGADPRDGSGPGPPFGPTSSGWLPDRAPLSTGRSGPSRVSPARLSLTRATTAIGPGTRTALAHCAVPGPTPARDCRGGSSWWVSCDGRRSPWWSEGLLSTPP